jgi:hypothetical protein
MIFRGMRCKTHVAMIIAIIVRSGVEFTIAEPLPILCEVCATAVSDVH